MTTTKGTSAKTKASKASHAKSGDTAPKHVGKDTLNNADDNVAHAVFDKVKEAVPSFDDVADTLRDSADIDFQNMAEDAATFVRRNPAVSIAAAAGIGVLIGVLATKRS